MMCSGRSIVRLEVASAIEMCDLVQKVGDHLSHEIGLDEDSAHWVGVAIRESMINAITHGNRNDAAKRVFVAFETTVEEHACALTISVRDEGEGFDPTEIADPLLPENVLKSNGRGIFLIRRFMDDVRVQQAPQGGMEIRMTKRVVRA